MSEQHAEEIIKQLQRVNRNLMGLGLVLFLTAIPSVISVIVLLNRLR